MPLLWLYKRTMTFGKPVIMRLLQKRLKTGKEDPNRLPERFGTPSRVRPEHGPLIWVHVASVGEAQSMIQLISLFLDQNPTGSALVTSITRTSAELLENRLPARAFHQYLPVDRPKWAKRFLNYWHPDMILWAESELWPVIISEIGKRHIPMALVNARMSRRSFQNWSYAKGTAATILSAFNIILTQTDQDQEYYRKLGARSVRTVGNIKFASPALPYIEFDLQLLRNAVGDRPVWVYASTHAGEEELATKTHIALQETYPNLLTIVIPRHPERVVSINKSLEKYGLTLSNRTKNRIPPHAGTEIYLVDTLGELGLFYRLCPISCIGRSFSDDGGGGHNPLEAAQLGSAVLHGPHVQNLRDIYEPMDRYGAALCLDRPEKLAPALQQLLSDKESLKNLSEKGYSFAESQKEILQNVIEELEPLFLLAELPLLKV